MPAFTGISSHRIDGREWIALGGGTGFLKYRLWPGEHGYTATGDRLLSQATFAFGVEYAKHLNGSLTKMAECGQRDAATGTGRLSDKPGDHVCSGRRLCLAADEHRHRQ